MKELIKYYNEKYGHYFINLEYPKTKKDMYRVYSYIKNTIESNENEFMDDEILEILFNKVILPKPKGIDETILYYQCKDFIGEEIVIEFNKLKENPVIGDISVSDISKFYSMELENFDISYFSEPFFIVGLKGYSWSFEEPYNEYYYMNLAENGVYPKMKMIFNEITEKVYLEIHATHEDDIDFVEKIIKNNQIIKLCYPKYLVNTKVHFLEDTDTFDDILPLVYKGYTFCVEKNDQYYFSSNDIRISIEGKVIRMFFAGTGNTLRKRVEEGGTIDDLG